MVAYVTSFRRRSNDQLPVVGLINDCTTDDSNYDRSTGVRRNPRMFSPQSPSSFLLSSALQQTLHKSLPAFSPYLPASLLPVLAFSLLAATFTLAFYFSTYVLRAPACTILLNSYLCHHQSSKRHPADPRGRGRVHRKHAGRLWRGLIILLGRSIRIKGSCPLVRTIQHWQQV